MKKLILILLTTTLFVSCSSDDDEPTQEYTSFVFYQPTEIDVIFPNCIAAYKKDNMYYKLGELGDMSKGNTSNEIRIDDSSINAVYLFTDYNGCIRLDDTYMLKSNNNNIFQIINGTRGVPVADKTDPTQYPQ